MPASLSLKETEKVNYRKMSDIIKKLKKLTNHILIDSAAGLGEEARSVMQASDEIIIVTNPEMAAVTDALKTIKLAEEMNKPVKGVIITRYRGVGTEMPISNIHDMLETSILGIIPEDEAVKISQVLKNAVVHTHPKSKAARNYMETSKRLLGESYKEPIIKQGLWIGILKAFGLK